MQLLVIMIMMTYRSLHNSVPYDEYEMSKIKYIIETRIDTYNINISINDVIDAVMRLKSGKSDGKNFVKQGGVLSSFLFAIYTDGLLKRLLETGVDCHMGHHFSGALAYADDITLLSPSQSGPTILVK